MNIRIWVNAREVKPAPSFEAAKKRAYRQIKKANAEGWPCQVVYRYAHQRQEINNHHLFTLKPWPNLTRQETEERISHLERIQLEQKTKARRASTPRRSSGNQTQRNP